jgi:hypothetical protein
MASVRKMSRPADRELEGSDEFQESALGKSPSGRYGLDQRRLGLTMRVSRETDTC